MKIVIIGSVAAGTSVAAKARRNDEQAEITLYNADYDISYSGCGIPYFLGGEVDEIESLTPRNPAWFKKRYNVDIFVRHEVIAIDVNRRKIQVKNLDTDEVIEDIYDVLVFATGASPLTPPIEGVEKDHVFHIRTIQDTSAIDRFIKKKEPRRAAIIGAGYIGLEMAEQLTNRGLEVTLVQRSNHILSHMDQDIVTYVEEHLVKKGLTFF